MAKTVVRAGANAVINAINAASRANDGDEIIVPNEECRKAIKQNFPEKYLIITVKGE